MVVLGIALAVQLAGVVARAADAGPVPTPQRVAVIEIGDLTRPPLPQGDESDEHAIGWTYDAVLIRRALEHARCSGPDVIVLDVNAAFDSDEFEIACEIGQVLAAVQQHVRIVAFVHAAHGEVATSLWPVHEWYAAPDALVIDDRPRHMIGAVSGSDLMRQVVQRRQIAVKSGRGSPSLLDGWGIDEPGAIPTLDGGVVTTRSRDGVRAEVLVRTGVVAAIVESRAALLERLCGGAPEIIDESGTELIQRAASASRESRRALRQRVETLLSRAGEVRTATSVKQVRSLAKRLHRELDLLAAERFKPVAAKEFARITGLASGDDAARDAVDRMSRKRLQEIRSASRSESK